MYDVRFDWLPILNADFVNALVSEMFKAPDIKQSGVNVERVHQQRTYIARHVISALYQAWSSPHTLNTVSYPQKSSVYGKKIPSQIPYSISRARSFYTTYTISVRVSKIIDIRRSNSRLLYYREAVLSS